MDFNTFSSITGWIVLLSWSFKTHLSIAVDRLSPGQSLTGNQTVISEGGLFELGFFTPGNSHNYYIGIWHKKIQVRTVVWVANREAPLPNTSSELKIAEDGNLVLMNSSKIPIWSTNSTSIVSNSTVAVLLDTGNLVLRDVSDSFSVIWQSFDYPTDTWMPGGKLGLNKITGHIMRLTSWKSSEDPSPGPFSLELDTNGTVEFLLLWNRTQQYWTSGVWNGQYFRLVPETVGLSNPPLESKYNFTYITNNNESYFTHFIEDKSLILRFVLGVSGQYQAFTWVEAIQQWILYWSKPDDQCQLECLNNCSCSAYAFNSGCLIWTGDLLNLVLPSDGVGGVNLYLRLAASERPRSMIREILSILDTRLEGKADMEELDRACRVACWCIQEHEECRPSMRLVVQILEGVQQIGIPPIPNHLVAESISQGQSLSGNKTIVSQGGIFELGFFTPGNSQNYYIGIWYKRIQKQTVVWVANRETPLPNTSSELRIAEDGNLVLMNSSKIPIWSTNSTSIVSNSTVAVLLDTGNLVLRDGLDSSSVIWQSFEHPTDTWLPEGKIGVNKNTGEIMRLTSWRASDDPSPGPFSLELDTNETIQFLLMWNGSQRYWASGAWNGQYFSLIPESTALNSPALSNRYNFSFISTVNESYFTYLIKERSIVIRFVMDLSSGKIQTLTWLEPSQQWMMFWSQPTDQCDVYSLCGAFGSCNSKTLPFCTCLRGFEPRSLKDWSSKDWNGGCVRKTQLQCVSNSSVSGQKDGFFMTHNVKLPVNSLTVSVNSADECELVCLNNCSCTAYAFVGGCLIWMGDLLNVRQLSDGGSTGVGDLYLRLAASELQSSKSKRNANQSQDGTIVPFPFWAASKLNEGELLCILDSSLEGNADIDELDRACRVACWCIQEHEASRPSMGQVVQILEGVLQIDIPPLPCHLHRLVGDQSMTIYYSVVSDQSISDGSNA
ncbi:hypothetical protein MRB53_022356 [Persea americana]|nr:hypothetical protein MRB53_022356 [Persea americana]